MKLDIEHIETFLQVASLQSFSRAARMLNTTQPNVSIRIAALESRLGKKLFHRDKRRVKLTSEGYVFLEHAESIKDAWQRAYSAFSEGQDVQGAIRLGVSETIVHVWLSEFLKRFSEIYPKVEIDAHVDTSLHLRDLLLAREIDCAFLLGPVSEPTMTNENLCSIRLGFAVKPEMGEDFTDLEKLGEQTFITYSKHTKPSVKLFQDLKALKIARPRFIASSSLATNLELARTGVGIALLPKVLVEREKELGRLVEPKLPRGLKPHNLDFTTTFPISNNNFLIAQVARIARDVADKNS